MYRKEHKITEIHRNIQSCTEKYIFYFRHGSLLQFNVGFELVFQYVRIMHPSIRKRRDDDAKVNTVTQHTVVTSGCQHPTQKKTATNSLAQLPQTLFNYSFK